MNIACQFQGVALLLFSLLGIGFMNDDLFGQLVSPEVHADRSVTFRLRAPEADNVFVAGLAGREKQRLEMDTFFFRKN